MTCDKTPSLHVLIKVLGITVLAFLILVSIAGAGRVSVKGGGSALIAIILLILGLFIGNSRKKNADIRNKSSRNLEPARNVIVPSEPKMIVRYPNLECPDRVTLDEKFSLLVQLLLKSPKPNVKGMAIENKGLFDQPPEVELVIYANGFDIEGSHHKILKVDISKDSDDFFVLTPRKLGEQQIRVDFYQYEKRIGTERRNVLVKNRSIAINVKQPESSGALQLNSELKGHPPDLEICVQLDYNDKRTLYFVLHTTRRCFVNPQTGEKKIGYHHERFGSVPLTEPPDEKIKDLCDKMSQMAGRPEIDAEHRMAALGNELWDELIPDKLKDEYWEFKDYVKSMLITSDEPWIQWEMIKPYRYKDDSYEKDEDLFWCQKFELSRWLSGPAPADELSTGRAQPVAPVTTNLPSVQEEVTFIEQLGNLNPGIKGLALLSDKVQVLDFLEKGNFSLLHFASHCRFNATNPNDSGIQLSNGSLRPSDIHTHFGGNKRPRPLIFLNVCEGAQLGFSFTGLGGWADRLVEDYVGAFVGAAWEVNDALALEFAKSFYTALLKDNKTIAQAFRIARETVREIEPANSTWLAYVLYADPEACAVGTTM